MINEKKFARAVLFDTEPKVIKEVNSYCSSWSYRHDGYKIEMQGAGNNWAMGFFTHGPAFEDDCLEILQREIERCDQLHGFLAFSSVAGGTGSGLGSFMSEKLRDHYPKISSANITVWPFQRGDVSVQAYNSVLTLAALQNSSDAVIMFENDWLLKLCRQKMALSRASMPELNTVASQQLANLLLPVESCNSICPRFNDLLAHLVPHPQYKLLGLRAVPQEPVASLPFSAHTWSGLLRSLRRMVLYDSVIDEVYGKCASTCNVNTRLPISLCNLLVLRGRDSKSADWNLLHKPSLPYTSWVPSSFRLKTLINCNSFLSYDRTAVLANNGQLSICCVDVALKKAWSMFYRKAYFHHYEDFGLSKDDFKLSIRIVHQIISSYETLAI
ncbi:tubulin delta chain-like [Uloborus diversus]|uniref:tubulin delta chain-like n=1 Tax=Uloborus diversus TaxID=327109 RepID=UPI002409B73E|nr:tubulin delta chain-like [Uloborus diversus]